MKMKKALAACMAVMMIGSTVLMGCGSQDNSDTGADTKTEATGASGPITVVSREDGSGTRGAFVELFGVQQEDKDGEKIDMTTLDAKVTNSTSVMMTTVAGDVNAIGYISLGSLNDTVKAVKIDGTEPSAENVENESYKVVRPFNIAVKDDVSEAAQDFINFIMSKQGQAVVEENGYIPVGDQSEYKGTSPEGKIVVAGSSSISPVMEKLKEAYEEVNANATIEVQQSDSTTGMQSVIDGLCDIGMASRELKDSETSEGLSPTVIAQDGIAVIVNNDSGIDELTSDQVKSIYLGDALDWEDVLE
ncbi:Phosphate-binding protein pstS precursor [Blautia hydrogenotrophica]|mgnify:FL=1|uniref:substrate-binding domain-containing protein n=1 Tax=Blautia hydrogenotrophica TaxID=53443 RepID=UPI0006C445CD|nr:substrate-binding domain-containing protein [Blautia hydrogenotrophica]CUM89955.1 Phosphate-binding protein pstS precursor [Blautia hydrogenotrophica]SCH55497.1 Phosphate-binding protein pstS precursor [uncultured Blautia sp.]